MYNAKITVHYKESVIDPRAQQTLIALEKITPAVAGLKMGQVFTLNIQADNQEEAQEVAELCAKELLVNQVMENYTVEVEEEAK